MINGLGKRLKVARINSNMSRKQVAKRLGISESIIGLYETESRQPSLHVLVKLSSLYKVTTDYLLGCEPSDSRALSLTGMTPQQIEALSLTAKCFRSQNI